MITNEEGGIKRVVSRTPATAAGGAPWVAQLSMTFGKHGRLVAWGLVFRPVKG